MLTKNMTKVEIENELKGKGDYVQIDNITRFLKDNVPLNTKKFLYTKLMEIYERRNMFGDAAEACTQVIESSLVPAEKREFFLKRIEFYIKAGFFDKADLAIRQCITENAVNKDAVMANVKEYFLEQAKTYEKEKRRNRAARTYEKLLSLNLKDEEKRDISSKLIILYKELGMVHEYMAMSKKV